MQRAVAAALIKPGRTRLMNPGNSADDKAALSIIKQLGAKVEFVDNSIEITGCDFGHFSGTIYCNESGLSARLFTSLAALSDAEITINGSGSLTKRPFGFFEIVLPELNVRCESTNGSLPLQIKGPLVPKNIVIDGSVSSQFLTGLLFAYSAAGISNVTIEVKELTSKPYIDLTLSVLQDFGLTVPKNLDYRQFVFESGKKRTTTELLEYRVEGDWSAAAFLLVAGVTSGTSLEVKGLNLESVQADKMILTALQRAGSDMVIRHNCIEVKRSAIKGFQFDAIDCPDLFPPLVALAAHAEGRSVITGIHRLEYKESNRANTLQSEFRKMGVEVEFKGDDMIITPPDVVNATVVNSHNDHRIAMALAVAALGAKGETVIEGAGSVNKSYPDLWKDLSKLNALVSLTET
jgi:3-phosphoshikimate 1-carboxyvinyltransferase